jgi:hypothetical protein
MSFSYKKWFGAGIILVIIVLLFGISQTRAQTGAAASSDCPDGTKLSGWAWSSNSGWVSFSSSNASGGGGPHCVSIDSSGNLVGWAWSSNIGWIKFGGLSSFPTVVGASTAGNAHVDNSTTPPQIVGWARACAGTADGRCAAMTSRTDGWDGWIEVGNTTHPMTYSGNSISGYAWGADVIGWMQFMVTTTQTITSTASCTIAAQKVQGNTYELSWNSQNTNNCSAFSNNFTVNGTSGRISVTPTVDTTYSLSCTPSQSGGAVASCSVPVTVSGGGGGPGPGGGGPIPTDTPNLPAIQMWLNDVSSIPFEAQSTMTIRLGQQAKVNWRNNTSTSYSGCDAQIDSSYISDGSFTTTDHPNGSPYIIPASFMTTGPHTFRMSCTSTVGGSTVDGKTKAGASALNIRVLDSSIREE